ncbi:MAG: stage 0 sporulation family protein [Defluviitaleaceae bacterium]|nr:stage 0 sporulation family protein [Defluviitaleaceae bacterium]
MKNVVGVRFKKAGKIFYFENNGIEDLKRGTEVIVQSIRGLEYGKIEIEDAVYEAKEGSYVERKATQEDRETHISNKLWEKEAIVICKEKIFKHGLSMKIIDADLIFDFTKVIFYFTSETRVDFRDLVKDLAYIFRMRIELRQVGVRDEAKAINSVGMCGRSLCCSTFLGSFQPVSIKMAKNQGLSLNPNKIFGACGRLMCCLKYEEDTYEHLGKNLPNQGDIVKTVDGNGKVVAVHTLQQLVKVEIIKEDAKTYLFYHESEIELVKKVFKEEDEDLEKMKKLLESF